MATSNITSAALFRSVEKWRPTLLVDEYDTFARVSPEITNVLNAGHRRTGTVTRVVGDQLEPRVFSVFGAKAIAGIGGLPDTIEDRSIHVRLKRKKSAETVSELRLARIEAEGEPTKQRLWRYIQDNFDAIREADPDVPTQLHDRARDNWRPLLAIADSVGGDWPRRDREAAIALAGGLGQQERESRSVLFLADLHGCFGENETDVLSTETLIQSLVAREERDYSEWKDGRPITPRQLARTLSRFEKQDGCRIGPTTIKRDGKSFKGYRREFFMDAWDRFLPPASTSAIHTESEASARWVAVSVTAETMSEGPGRSQDPRHVTTVSSSVPGYGAENGGSPDILSRVTEDTDIAKVVGNSTRGQPSDLRADSAESER